MENLLGDNLDNNDEKGKEHDAEVCYEGTYGVPSGKTLTTYN